MLISPLLAFIVPPLIVNVPATVPRACALLIFNVPALNVTPPVKVFTPERVHIPASCLVTVPLVVPIILSMLPPCAPPKVKP